MLREPELRYVPRLYNQTGKPWSYTNQVRGGENDMLPRRAHDGFVLGTQGWLLISVLLWILLDESMLWRQLLVPLLLVIRLSRHGLLLNKPDLIRLSCQLML